MIDFRFLFVFVKRKNEFDGLPRALDRIGQVARKHHPVELCKRRMAELASTLDAATELQAEFYTLS
jgi:hypothetical protein